LPWRYVKKGTANSLHALT